MAVPRSVGLACSAGGAQRSRASLTVALVVPLSGPAGIFGPSCELCATLAAEEFNAGDGVLGREVRFVVVDGGRHPQVVADQVEVLVRARAVEAVVGWHISAVRQAVASRIGGSVPYVYTALYEGGERTPGVFLTGEVPSGQIDPPVRWMRDNYGTRRWYIVGDDYIWPRLSASAARRYVRAAGGTVCGQTFVPLGTRCFDPVLHRIAQREPDAVLMLLVGDDSVQFNRAFHHYGFESVCRRFSPLMEENMVLAIGAESTRGLFAAAGFFEALVTPESLDFSRRYHDRFGASAPPLNSLGESCYEGLRLLGALAARARGIEASQLCVAASDTGYDGPRGHLDMRGFHLDQRVYLAEAEGLDLLVKAQL